jgi:uncharacterized membrane protein YkvA (DUF1232 family)
MAAWHWALVGVAASGLAAYATAVVALAAAGQRTGARALAGFIPDCVVLVRRLLGDPRVAWWRKALLGLLIAYLALPFDLMPDFIPVAGQLDDAIVVALVLRSVLGGAGEALLREHWPGPERSLRVVRDLATRRRASHRDPGRR